MSCINVTACKVLNNPTMFTTPFQFEVSFECIAALKDDLEWKMIYVGSAEDEQYDQELESVLVGPVEMGINRFIFQADAPDASRIPPNDILGVTVVLVTCSYKEKEFIRIGYYVQNEWTNPEFNENPPEGPVDVLQVQRNILEDKPRVTRFGISWDEDEQQQQLQQQQQQQMQMQQQQMQMQPHQMAQMQQQQMAKPLMQQDMNQQASMLPQAMMQQAPKDFAGVPAGGMAWSGGVAGGMDVDL